MGRRMAVRVVAQDPSLRDSDDSIVTTVVGIPARLVEERSEQQAARFAAYAVVQESDDPYAKAIQSLVAQAQDLERTVADLHERLASIEKDQQREQLRVVKS